MKPLLLITLCCLTLTAATPDAKTQKEITAALDAWKQALLHSDRPALEKMFAPELVYTHSNDRQENKAQAIETVMNGPDKYEAIDVAESWIQVYGNTAVVKAKITMKVIQSGKPNTLPLDVLHVFVKGASGWQLVARQSTRIP